MDIFRSLNEVPAGFGPTIAGVGNFDGVHCGHAAILGDMCARAAQTRARTIVVTFDPHPARLLQPDAAPPLITPMPERLRLLASHGVEATLVLPFTREFSEWTPRLFAERVLRDALGATSVHEGDNFRFGHRASAGLEELAALGAEMGFRVVPHSLLRLRGLPVSSSEVRARVGAGAVETARTLLGRPFSIRSVQARGRGIGTRLLVPTVNLAPYAELKPAHGVYVTRLRIGDGPGARTFEAITNAGNRPTFGPDSYAIESHLFGFHPEQEAVPLDEHTPLELAFLHRLRGEQRFDSPDALRAQIGRDIAAATRYHRLATRLGTGPR